MKLVKESLNERYESNEKRNLDRISNFLHYDDFEEFIGDNPGCYNAIIDWIESVADFSKQLTTASINIDTLRELGLWKQVEIAERYNDDEG